MERLIYGPKTKETANTMKATPGGSSSCSEGKKAGPSEHLPMKFFLKKRNTGHAFSPTRTRGKMKVSYRTGFELT